MRYLFLSFVAGALFASCRECSEKDVTCPAYQERGGGTWFPYVLNDRIIFRNNTAYDTINIKNIESSAAYNDRLSSRNPWCNASKHWMSAERSASTLPKLMIDEEQRSDAFTTERRDYTNIIFREENFVGGSITDTGLAAYSSFQQSRYYASLTLGSATFSNVQVLITDTIQRKSARPYKIWIAKGKGVVAYEEYPSLNLWVKQ